MTHVEVDRQQNDLPLSELISRCQEETARFFKKQVSDGRYCYEIFRRAVVEKSQAAWDALYQQYGPLVLHWLQSGNRIATVDESLDILVNETFTKFFVAFSAEKFAASLELSSILDYLKLCAGSLLVDRLRRRNLGEGEEDPELPDHDESALQIVENQELYDQINQRLKDDDEKLLFFAMFTLAMKPREICDEWPDRFATIQRVNQIRQNIVSRLQRDESLQRYYQDI